MFGNKIEVTTDNGALTATELGTTGLTAVKWNATKKIYEGSFTNRDTAGSVGLSLAITGGGADAVTAFGTPSKSLFFTVSATDLQAANAALQAQVAALQAQIADMRTKARSVTLKRWNDLVMRHRALGGSAKLK
jgi:hypothetical protein